MFGFVTEKEYLVSVVYKKLLIYFNSSKVYGAN